MALALPCTMGALYTGGAIYRGAGNHSMQGVPYSAPLISPYTGVPIYRGHGATPEKWFSLRYPIPMGFSGNALF